MKDYMEKTLPLIDKALKHFFPEKISKSWVSKELGAFDYELDDKTFNSALTEPFYDFMGRGGKRLRAILTCLTYQILGGKSDSIYRFALIPELIHNGTLIIDDIEDHSELRRGKPVLHKVFGVDIAVNVGNFIYFLPQLIVKNSKITDSEKARLYRVVAEELTKLHIGQALDIQWGKTKKYDVSTEQYLQMCTYKTGALMGVALKIGAVLADASDSVLKNLSKVAVSVGIAFQIQDDILNLKADWGKQNGEDITQGKLTYMVADTISRADDNDRKELIKILSSKTKKQEEIKKAITIMEKYDAFSNAQAYSQKLVTVAKNTAKEVFPNNDYRRVFLEILDFVVNRKH